MQALIFCHIHLDFFNGLKNVRYLYIHIFFKISLQKEIHASIPLCMMVLRSANFYITVPWFYAMQTLIPQCPGSTPWKRWYHCALVLHHAKVYTTVPWFYVMQTFLPLCQCSKSLSHANVYTTVPWFYAMQTFKPLCHGSPPCKRLYHCARDLRHFLASATIVCQLSHTACHWWSRLVTPHAIGWSTHSYSIPTYFRWIPPPVHTKTFL